MKATRPMLAGVVDLDKLKYPVLVSPKLDGVRCMVIDHKAVSRSGKLIPNEYVQECAMHWLNGMDGELIVGDPKAKGCFNRTTSGVMRAGGFPTFTYYVFDSFAHPTAPYQRRMEMLPRSIIGSYNLANVKQHQANTREALEAYLDLWVGAGYEGLMVRDPNAPYKFGRSTVKEGYLLKVKPYADAEGVVVGFEEMLHNDNPKEKDELGYTKRSSKRSGKQGAGCLGRLLVESPLWQGVLSIGSGFTAEQRRAIWKTPAKYRGACVKFKYQECGTKDLPRCPIFLGWRDPRDM